PREVRALLAREARVVAQGAHRLGALGLDDGPHVDARGGHGEGDLDRELVAARGAARHGGGPPGLDSGVAARREPELLDLLGGGVVGSDVGLALALLLRDYLDESVPHEALDRRVGLADVERPRTTRALLEALAQVVAVRGLFSEQREHPLADRHGDS